MRRWKDDLSLSTPNGEDMQRIAAGESCIFLSSLSLCLSHPPPTPVILQSGGMPYGCKELLPQMISHSQVARCEERPSIQLWQYAALWDAEQKTGLFVHKVFVFTNLSCACRHFLYVCRQTRTPRFLFFSHQKKKWRREKVGEEQNTMGVGWDADKVDYEVFPSYLPSTRRALLIKSVLLFYSWEVGLFCSALGINCLTMDMNGQMWHEDKTVLWGYIEVLKAVCGSNSAVHCHRWI